MPRTTTPTQKTAVYGPPSRRRAASACAAVDVRRPTRKRPSRPSSTVRNRLSSQAQLHALVRLAARPSARTRRSSTGRRRGRAGRGGRSTRAAARRAPRGGRRCRCRAPRRWRSTTKPTARRHAGRVERRGRAAAPRGRARAAAAAGRGGRRRRARGRRGAGSTRPTTSATTASTSGRGARRTACARGRGRARACPSDIAARPSWKSPLEASANVGCPWGLRRPCHSAQPERTMQPGDEAAEEQVDRDLPAPDVQVRVGRRAVGGRDELDERGAHRYSR